VEEGRKQSPACRSWTEVRAASGEVEALGEAASSAMGVAEVVAGEAGDVLPVAAVPPEQAPRPAARRATSAA
jgi:hypothetical protein